MRILSVAMRRVGLACLLAGLLGAIVYPIWFSTYNDIELGTYRVFDAQGGFRAITDVSLSPAAEPLSVTLIGRSQEPPAALDDSTTVTLVVNNAGGTVAAEVITLTADVAEFGPETETPQELRATVPPIEGLGNGDYDFIFGEGDRTEIPLAYLDMVLTAAAATPDARVAPVSWALTAFGVALLVVFSRRGGRRKDKKAGRKRPERSGAAPERTSRTGTSNIGRRVPLDRKPEETSPEPRQWGRGDD